MYKTYGVFVGVLIAIMVTINGTLASNIGDYYSTVIIHITGLSVAIIILLIRKTKVRISKGIPVYLFSGGIIGAFMVVFNNMCFSQLGVSLTLALGLVGQLVASAVIDHYGLFGLAVNKFKKEKLLGFIIIITGIIMMVID